MSPEEAIKVLQQVRQWTDYPKEAFTMAIKALEQSLLPSNLNEAAEEYAPDFSNDFASKAAVEAMRDAFKAGAGWMAGQGLTVTGKFHHSRGYPSVIELNTYLRDYEGKDVIVQIQKKQ